MDNKQQKTFQDLKIEMAISKAFELLSKALEPEPTNLVNNESVANEVKPYKEDYLKLEIKTALNAFFNLEQEGIVESLDRVFRMASFDCNNSEDHKDDLFNVYNLLEILKGNVALVNKSLMQDLEA